MENSENEETGLEKIVDSIESVITGIPAPVRKNFFKAFGHLCTAAVDVPVTWLEGKSAEIKASSDARIKIIRKEGNEFSERIEIPKEYIAKASEKFASRIIREQLNLDEITLNAAKELSSHKKTEEIPSENQKEIEDDWLNEFETHGRIKSSDDMKIIFGKILSGEISNPGTFSIRTIRLISQLDNKAAKLFQRLCSNAICMNIADHIMDVRVVSLEGNAASNSLSQFGLPFDSLNVLQEYGLIITDYNSYMIYSMCITHELDDKMPSVNFGGKNYALMPTDNDKYDKSLRLSGVALTKSGTELFNIIPKEENSRYKKALDDFFLTKYLKLVEIKE